MSDYDLEEEVNQYKKELFTQSDEEDIIERSIDSEFNKEELSCILERKTYFISSSSNFKRLSDVTGFKSEESFMNGFIGHIRMAISSNYLKSYIGPSSLSLNRIVSDELLCDCMKENEDYFQNNKDKSSLVFLFYLYLLNRKQRIMNNIVVLSLLKEEEDVQLGDLYYKTLDRLRLSQQDRVKVLQLSKLLNQFFLFYYDNESDEYWKDMLENGWDAIQHYMMSYLKTKEAKDIIDYRIRTSIRVEGQYVQKRMNRMVFEEGVFIKDIIQLSKKVCKMLNFKSECNKIERFTRKRKREEE